MVMNSSFLLPTDGNASVSGLYAVCVLTTIVLVVSLPLNIYVLRLIVIGERNGVASELFSVNLCVCEIFICFNVVVNIFNIIVYKNEENRLFYSFLLFSSLMYTITRPFFQCCICVERYVAVIHPIIFLKCKPLRYRTALSVVAWIIVMGFSVFCTFLQVRNILYFVLLPEYLLEFSIKILCSIAVLKALRKPRPGEKLSVRDAESNHMKKKAFTVIVIILFFMFITYFPVVILIFVYDSLSDRQRGEAIVVLSYIMISAGFGHPLMYLLRVGKLNFIPGLRFK